MFCTITNKYTCNIRCREVIIYWQDQISVISVANVVKIE